MPRPTRLERNDLPSQWPPDLIPVTDKGKKISGVFFGRASQQIYVGQTPAHSPGWKRTVRVLEQESGGEGQEKLVLRAIQNFYMAF
jgi:hypothetical protein